MAASRGPGRYVRVAVTVAIGLAAALAGCSDGESGSGRPAAAGGPGERGGAVGDCPPIDAIRHAGSDAVDGGCAFRLATGRAELLVDGDRGRDGKVVATCASRLTINMADNVSAALVDQVSFDGARECRRMRPCPDGTTGLRYPWQGPPPAWPPRPPLVMRFDICLRTLAGRARGFIAFRVRHGPAGWTATAGASPIGSTPVTLSGTWRIRPAGFGRALAASASRLEPPR